MQLTIAYINNVYAYLEPHNELFYNGGNEVTKTADGFARIASIENFDSDRNDWHIRR